MFDHTLTRTEQQTTKQTYDPAQPQAIPMQRGRQAKLLRQTSSENKASKKKRVRQMMGIEKGSLQQATRRSFDLLLTRVNPKFACFGANQNFFVTSNWRDSFLGRRDYILSRPSLKNPMCL